MQKCLSKATKEELDEIKRLAGLLFVPREIAIMLEFDEDAFVVECELKDTAVYRAFHGGRLQRTVLHREKIIKLADSGSSPAQTMVEGIIKETAAKMMDK
jgi:hypothetical protein